MKKNVSIVLLFILVFFAFSDVSAQEKKVAEEESAEKKLTDAEFKAIQAKSAEKINGKNYRLQRTSKTFKKSDNSLAYFFKETTEYMLPDNSRTVSENGSGSGNPTLTEIIKIGRKAYTRINKGNWTISEVSGNTVRNGQTTTGNTVEHTFKGKVDFNSRKADLYESKYITKTIKGGRDFVTTVKAKSWFDKDGVLLKIEEEIETNNTITRKVFEWEYDPQDLNIEAPTK